jgi:cytochrome b561
LKNNVDLLSYSKGAKAFHWIIVFLLISQFAVAWTMDEIGRGTRPTGLIAWHLSIGVAILAVAVLRLGWRMTHKPPPPPETLNALLRIISRATHYLLYGLLLILPLMGWANASARGWQVTLFGIFRLPQIVPTGSALGRAMGDIHATTAIVLLAAVGMHVAGACYHAFILRDGTIQRMLWRT